MPQFAQTEESFTPSPSICAHQTLPKSQALPDDQTLPKGQALPTKATSTRNFPAKRVLWLQGLTLAWMLVELGVSAYAAATAHSAAILAFGSDSLVEVLSATVVLLQWAPRFTISERRATRVASVLLFVLAFVVAATAFGSLVLHVQPETSVAGIGITLAALVVMPIIASWKHSEARRLGNSALAADAVQSATCAYLAVIALVGLAANAFFHIAWFDSVAALIAVPILIREGRSAWRGQSCGCC
jgi:divalent metal cation (Fe/Co/Zn/Cd) transporter